MGSIRKHHSNEFKAHIAIEALRGQKTRSELASEFGVHPVQISQWTNRVPSGDPHTLLERGSSKPDDHELLLARLYQQIGQLQVAGEWLRKKGLLPAPKNGQ